jgi:hypothetical protein
VTYSIDKNVPWHDRVLKELPLMSLEVGDSFLVPEADYAKPTAMMQKLRIEFERCKSINPDLRFRQKQVEGGIRVWRKQY